MLKKNNYTPFPPVHTGPRHLNDMSVKSFGQIPHGSSTAALLYTVCSAQVVGFCAAAAPSSVQLPPNVPTSVRRQAAMTTVEHEHEHGVEAEALQSLVIFHQKGQY